MTSLDGVEAALTEHGLRPRRRGSTIDAHCPTHDDTRPSLSVTGTADGTVLMRCHAGCRTEEVVAALGLTMAALFPEKATSGAGKHDIATTYDYLDEGGTLRYQVVRLIPKSFRQRRPDGRGGWTWHLRGGERVPYRLPELRAGVKAGRWVVVVEGEKDADNLRSLGFVATTNAQGAAWCWPKEWAERYFTGARVAIIPDHDEPGRVHAGQVASVLHGHAAEVRVVALSGLAEHGDVSDWLHLGHSAEELKRLIRRQAPGWEPERPACPAKVQPSSTDLRVPTTRALLRAVELTLKRYVVFATPAQATAVALWVLHTYTFEATETTPYLAVTSATKRSGKSRLLELLALLVREPWYVTEPTEAVLFRKVEATRPTLLVDEVDATFGKDSTATEGLRAIYNAGYRRGATVPRCVGQDHAVRDFTVYCPKVFAGIRALPDTIADRSIPITLRRRAPDERLPERFRLALVKKSVATLVTALAAWGEAHIEDLAGAYPDLPEELSDRGQDAWEALLAIADLAGKRWGDRARAAATELMGDQEDADLGVTLLTHCRDALEGHDILLTLDLLRHLVNRGDESPWARWWSGDIEHEHSKGPASRLAALLKPFDVHPRQVWVDGAKGRGYRREDFEPAWERYCPTAVGAAHTDPSNGRTVGPRSEAISEGNPRTAKSAPDQDCTVLPSLPSVGRGKRDGRNTTQSDKWDALAAVEEPADLPGPAPLRPTADAPCPVCGTPPPRPGCFGVIACVHQLEAGLA